MRVALSPKVSLENFPATGHNIEIGELKTIGLGIAPWRLTKTSEKATVFYPCPQNLVLMLGGI